MSGKKMAEAKLCPSQCFVCVGGEGFVEVIIWLREVCGTVSTLPL